MFGRKKKSKEIKAKKPKKAKKKAVPKSWRITIGREEHYLKPFCALAEQYSYRPYLRCVRFTDNFSEATNGHLMARINYTKSPGIGFPEKGILVNPQDLKLDGKHPSPTAVFVQDGDNGGKVVGIEKGEPFSRPVALVDNDEYPGTDSVYPTGKPDGMSRTKIRFNPKYIKQIATFADRCGADALEIELVRHPQNETHPPSVFRFYNHDKTKEIVCLLMPLRD